MARQQAIINLIKKLAEEAKAAKPIVKEAKQMGGALMKEGQLAKGQKIIQKLPTTDEYLKTRAINEFNLDPLNQQQIELEKKLEKAYEMAKNVPSSNKSVMIDESGNLRIFDKQTGKEIIDDNLKISTLKKAAAGLAGIPMSGELGSKEQEATPVPEKGILDKAKELGIAGLAKGVEAYEKLPRNYKENLSAAMDVLSQPSAALRGATLAAQKGQPILEATKQAWRNPEEAPTGEQIAEATGLSDEYPNLKASIATAADFADPIDLMGLGSLERFGKIKKLTGK